MNHRELRMSESLASVDSLELRHLCDMSIELDLQSIPSPAGNRTFFAILEGRVEGERLSGSFRSNGGDWVTLGSDLIGRVDVRATIETDDGELVYMTNTGRVSLHEEASAALAAGEHLTHDRIYARTAPLFETRAGHYAWLNGITTVAINEISLNHVDYRIFEVL